MLFSYSQYYNIPRCLHYFLFIQNRRPSIPEEKDEENGKEQVILMY